MAAATAAPTLLAPTRGPRRLSGPAPGPAAPAERASPASPPAQPAGSHQPPARLRSAPLHAPPPFLARQGPARPAPMRLGAPGAALARPGSARHRPTLTSPRHFRPATLPATPPQPRRPRRLAPRPAYRGPLSARPAPGTMAGNGAAVPSPEGWTLPPAPAPPPPGSGLSRGGAGSAVAVGGRGRVRGPLISASVRARCVLGR